MKSAFVSSAGSSKLNWDKKKKEKKLLSMLSFLSQEVFLNLVKQLFLSDDLGMYIVILDSYENWTYKIEQNAIALSRKSHEKSHTLGYVTLSRQKIQA